MPPRLQNLPVLQPGELGLRLALCLAGEDGGGPHRPSDGLRSLNKLCWSWKRRNEIKSYELAFVPTTKKRVKKKGIERQKTDKN